MNKQTYYLIADIIQRYRTWIIVKDTELLVEMRILQDGVLKTLFYKGLSLQSYRDHYSFRKKRTWKINEYDLNQGLAALCKKDPSGQPAFPAAERDPPAGLHALPCTAQQPRTARAGGAGAAAGAQYPRGNGGRFLIFENSSGFSRQFVVSYERFGR